MEVSLNQKIFIVFHHRENFSLAFAVCLKRDAKSLYYSSWHLARVSPNDYFRGTFFATKNSIIILIVLKLKTLKTQHDKTMGQFPQITKTKSIENGQKTLREFLRIPGVQSCFPLLLGAEKELENELLNCSLDYLRHVIGDEILGLNHSNESC